MSEKQNILTTISSTYLLLGVTLFVLLIFVEQSTCQLLGAHEPTKISCYRCRSKNFTDRSCHDPFTKSSSMLIERCHVAMGSSKILVPANHCIKVIGISEITGEEYVIRDCIIDAPDNGECAIIPINDDRIKRCTWSCSSDGCNRGATISRQTTPFLEILLVILSIGVIFDRFFHSE